VELGGYLCEVRAGPAATESGLCFFHANPDEASELGRIGGRSERNRVAENADPLVALDNAMAGRDTVARLITDVYEGKLHPRVAAGVAPLMTLQLRAIESTDQEQRIAKMEKKLEKLAAKENFDGRGEQ
jgi:hypothetical protein